MPRPNCASVPMIFTSEAMVTSVSPAAFSTTRLVIRMSAPPLPLVSWPDATISAVRAWASIFSNRSVPLNAAVTGPTFIVTVPVYVRSSVCPVMAAPGMHCATRRRSVRNAHVASGDALTTNVLVISMIGAAGQLRQQPLERFEIVRRQKSIDEGARGRHRACRRFVARIAREWIQPDDPPRTRSNRLHGGGNPRRVAAIQAVAQDD